jgi:hypothetical protein
MEGFYFKVVVYEVLARPLSRGRVSPVSLVSRPQNMITAMPPAAQIQRVIIIFLRAGTSL